MKRDLMPSEKMRITKIIQPQPDDNLCDEILRELAIARMVERGLKDPHDDRKISNEEMQHRTETWQKFAGP